MVGFSLVEWIITSLTLPLYGREFTGGGSPPIGDVAPPPGGLA
jgi:hypothetical protein